MRPDFDRMEEALTLWVVERTGLSRQMVRAILAVQSEFFDEYPGWLEHLMAWDERGEEF